MVSEQTFRADAEGLAACQAFLASICENPRPQIVMDEIVSNIVRCSGAAEFSARLVHDAAGGVTEMTFADAGRPFDPTREIAEPDVTAKLEDRQVGGLGMFMVRKLSQRVAYRREDGRNILSVFF